MSKELTIAIIICLAMTSSLHSQTVEQLVANGNAAYNKKAYREAQRYYELAISKDVTHQWPQATFNLGNALYQQKKYNEAARQFTALRQLTVSEELKSATLYNLGNCFLEQENYAEAMDVYRQALKLNPLDEDARYNFTYARAILTGKQGTSVMEEPSMQEKPQPETLEQPPLSPEELDRLKNQLSESENQTLENMQKQPVRQKKVKKDW